MKRILFGVLMGLLVSVGSFAARALSLPFEVAQPDGTVLTMVLNGDEHMSWLTTTDGTMVVEKDKGYYVAAIGDNGELQATRQLAHNLLQRADAERQIVLQQQPRKALFFNRAEQLVQQRRRAQIADANPPYFPHLDQPKTLVILVNFAEYKEENKQYHVGEKYRFTNADPKKQFDMLCNGETIANLGQNEDKNFTSVRRYFELTSHGKFNPQFDVVGPIELPDTLDYYGKDGSDYDTNFTQFCKDAIAAVDGDVDFNDYDNDGDGQAELVCVIYAGYGQNIGGNSNNTIWPKCGWKGITTNDVVKGGTKKVTVSYMNCGAELFRVKTGTDINGLGTFIHEMSHGLGLADHYVTPKNYSAQVNNQSTEMWDLMDYGEHVGNGYTPVPYTAWEQETMGWIEVEKLEETQNITEMLPLMKGGKAYKFGNGGDKEEWMYLENVQPRDKENQILGFDYGHGLLVSHVAYAKSTVSMGDYPNNGKAGSPRISIVPADGEVINGYLMGDQYTQTEYTNSLKGDPFPGTKAVDHLDASMGLPNYKFYKDASGQKVDTAPVQSLTNITETDGVISFTFNDGTPTGIGRTEITEITEKPNTFYDLQGRRVAQPTKGLYIVNGKKMVIK